MTLENFSNLKPQQVHLNVFARCKKHALEHIAQYVADTYEEVSCFDVSQAFSAREKIGSTGLGGGVALPHVFLDNVTAPLEILVTLETSIPFDSADGKPVDVIYAYIAPEIGRAMAVLQLSKIARELRDLDTVEAIRCLQHNPADTAVKIAA